MADLFTEDGNLDAGLAVTLRPWLAPVITEVDEDWVTWLPLASYLAFPNEVLGLPPENPPLAGTVSAFGTFVTREAGIDYWDPQIPIVPPPTVRASRDLLQTFLGISERAPRLIANFVQRWGPLRLCDHNQFMCRHCVDRRAARERLDGWRSRSKQAHALLSAAIEYRSGSVETKTWALVRQSMLEDEDAALFTGAGFWNTTMTDGHRLAALANEWLEGGDLRVRAEPAPRLHLTLVGNLAALIGLQLVAAAAGKSALGVCDHCGMPHFRERMPKRGSRTFCSSPECQSASRRSARGVTKGTTS